jgi:hypothetical protein
MIKISSILQEQDEKLNPPLFIFKRSPLAARHNAKILESYDFDLDVIIRNQHPSQISYGSEFRSTSCRLS